VQFIVAIALLFTSSTPFELRNETDIVVPVTIEGRGPFRFLLDTGSSRSAITPETARRLGRVPVAYTLVVAPGGHSRRGLIPIDRLSVGSTPATSVLAMLTENDEVGAAIDGLIGQDVLRARIYTIDYRSRRVFWHTDASTIPSAVRVPLDWERDRFVASLPQRSTGDLRLIPDSGTDGWVFFTRPNRSLPMLTPLDTVGMRTLGGMRLLRRFLIDAIDVGDVRLENQLATLVEKREADAPFEDGLLPLHLFARVTFNGPEKYLSLTRR
jgi:hypothetical protein